MKKFLTISTLFFGFLTAHASTISIICPTADQFNPPTKGSVYNFKFTATTFVDIPELNNQLTLTGEADSSKALKFHVATWTDRTFLCLYEGDKDMIVTYEGVLMDYVSSCRFEQSTSECESSNPKDCPLICQLNDEAKR